jgi:23S rRNA-/tRNA-specific pseudouridylate synthase
MRLAAAARRVTARGRALRLRAASSASSLRLFPVPDPPLPAKVRHLVVDGTTPTTVVEYLARALGDDGVDATYAKELLDIGAVWFAEAPPPRELRGVARERRARRLALGDGDGLGVREGNYLRVHVHPKRFPECYDIDWEECVLKKGDGFVVAHKPAGVSVVPTVDNARESCLAMLEKTLGAEEGCLKPIHRLDVGTEGVLVLGTTVAFAKQFGDMLAKRMVTKVYRVLTTNSVELGLHIHDATPATEGPRKMLMTKVETDDVESEIAKVAVRGGAERGGVSGPKRCILRVLESARVGDAYYESRVELLTGRTHQIRAQFAALGAPLVGETLYRSPEDDESDVRVQKPDERLGLHASEMHLKQDSALGPSGSVLRALDPWWTKEALPLH